MALVAQAPEPVGGAPCGIVDYLDFPVDPPDALNISRGGQDFGVFRSRFDGFHTGEDWWGPNRRSSLGEPVYAIGHGQITYAHPYGWGIDQGVIIVRHVDAIGRTFLSFYGHLDPPSVALRGGDCVARGQKIGEIGKPRGSAHLHFEIRTHTPGDPGPGYWSHDPTRSGWLPPSQTIWDRRLAVAPGVVWNRPFRVPGALPAAQHDGLLVLVEGASLAGVDLLDGVERWRQATSSAEEPPAIEAAVADAMSAQVYVASRDGRLSAFTLASDENASDTPPALRWTLKFENLKGLPTLFPLPEGGVAIAMHGRLIGLTPAGALLWREDFDVRVLDWLPLEGALLVTTTGRGPSLWTITNDGPVPWAQALSGALALAGNRVLLYDGDGVHDLDLVTKRASVFYALPHGVASQGDILGLADGTILVAHMDGGGRSLISLEADGSVRWRRALALGGQQRLLLVDGAPYLLTATGQSSWSIMTLFALALDDAALTEVMRAGTRSPIPRDNWLLAGSDGQLLVNVGGGSLVALQPDSAIAALCGAGPAAVCPSWMARGLQ
jgi:outer membrane protein assembly factor BamB